MNWVKCIKFKQLCEVSDAILQLIFMLLNPILHAFKLNLGFLKPQVLLLEHDYSICNRTKLGIFFPRAFASSYNCKVNICRYAVLSFVHLPHSMLS